MDSFEMGIVNNDDDDQQLQRSVADSKSQLLNDKPWFFWSLIWNLSIELLLFWWLLDNFGQNFDKYLSGWKSYWLPLLSQQATSLKKTYPNLSWLLIFLVRTKLGSWDLRWYFVIAVVIKKAIKELSKRTIGIAIISVQWVCCCLLL